MASIDQATKDKMFQAAFAATEKAYCPYSNFQVGAALLTESGEIITGGLWSRSYLGQVWF